MGLWNWMLRRRDIDDDLQAEIRSHLRGRGGVYENAFAEGILLRAAVNQDMVQPTAAVETGDEVAFFPPVTGG